MAFHCVKYNSPIVPFLYIIFHLLHIFTFLIPTLFQISTHSSAAIQILMLVFHICRKLKNNIHQRFSKCKLVYISYFFGSTTPKASNLKPETKTLISNILNNIIWVSLFPIQFIRDISVYLYIYTYINIVYKTTSKIKMGTTRTIWQNALHKRI